MKERNRIFLGGNGKKERSMTSQEEYIEDYKGYIILQDMENGYFVAYDNENDKQIAREATLQLTRKVLKERSG